MGGPSQLRVSQPHCRSHGTPGGPQPTLVPVPARTFHLVFSSYCVTNPEIRGAPCALQPVDAAGMLALLSTLAPATSVRTTGRCLGFPEACVSLPVPYVLCAAMPFSSPNSRNTAPTAWFLRGAGSAKPGIWGCHPIQCPLATGSPESLDFVSLPRKDPMEGVVGAASHPHSQLHHSPASGKAEH